MTKSARNLLTSGDKIPTCCPQKHGGFFAKKRHFDVIIFPFSFYIPLTTKTAVKVGENRIFPPPVKFKALLLKFIELRLYLYLNLSDDIFLCNRRNNSNNSGFCC